MDLILGYLAGVLTLVNPCVLPILPIVLVSAIQQDRYGPVALAAGMGLTFVIVGFSLAAVGPALGIDDRIVSRVAAILMIGFGLVLLVPRLNSGFAAAAGGLASSANVRLDDADQNGLRGQFVAGALLGAVWSPCIGPTLGGAVALASQGQHLFLSFMIMVFFALGIMSVMLALAYGTREAILRRQQGLRRLADKAKPIAGVVLIAVGAMILFDLQKIIEIHLLDAMPIWLQDLSVRF